MTEPTKLAYFAGFFDGEGTVGIKRTKSKNPKLPPTLSPFATVGQIAPEVLRQLKAEFGGNIHCKPLGAKNGVFWVWQIGGSKSTLPFLRAIVPYSIVKKAEIEVVIEAFSVPITLQKRFGVPDELRARRELAKTRVESLRCRASNTTSE